MHRFLFFVGISVLTTVPAAQAAGRFFAGLRLGYTVSSPSYSPICPATASATVDGTLYSRATLATAPSGATPPSGLSGSQVTCWYFADKTSNGTLIYFSQTYTIGNMAASLCTLETNGNTACRLRAKGTLTCPPNISLGATGVASMWSGQATSGNLSLGNLVVSTDTSSSDNKVVCSYSSGGLKYQLSAPCSKSSGLNGFAGTITSVSGGTANCLEN